MCHETCCEPKYEYRFSVNFDIQKAMIIKRQDLTPLFDPEASADIGAAVNTAVGFSLSAPKTANVMKQEGTWSDLVDTLGLGITAQEVIYSD
ncbi:hypothetical protein [Vibrio sp. TRT 17S01]|uniref:hypothetical protein n=1 Tax=Vibrio sp. TRT 17S01 TaxID=3418505 RepID=UPI003CEF714E